MGIVSTRPPGPSLIPRFLQKGRTEVGNEALLSPTLIELLETLPDGVVVVAAGGRIVAVNGQMCQLSGYLAEQLVGMPIETLVPTRLRAEHVARRASYISTGGGLRPMSQRLDIVLHTADGSELPVDIALSTMKHDDEKVVIATVRDATLRRQAELVVEQERAFFTALNEVSAALLAGGRIDETLRTVTAATRSMLNADLALVAVAEGDDLCVLAAEGDGAVALLGARVAADESLAGAVMREGEPMLLLDAATDPRAHATPEFPSQFGPALFVPMHARGSSLGCITIARHPGREVFAASDVTLMRSFASHAAIALADADAQERARRLQVLEDRERVAADVSENVINRISNVALTLHTLIGASPEHERLFQAIDDLDAAIAAIRSAIFPN
jgi:PAS domain S-box-containing protein